MDIPNELLYGFNPPPLTHPSARRLKIKDPRCIQRYNELLDQACELAHLYYKMDTLHQAATDPMTEQQQKEYEELDSQICKLMEDAELKCRRLCVGNVAWSPTYKEIILVMEYWRMRISHILGLHNNVRQLVV